MESDKKLIAKAKRRIKRLLTTGEPQARVHKVSEKLYEYKEVHHVRSLFFSVDSLNRLRLQKTK